MSQPASPDIALITGANKGIGRETARRLAGLGMTVLLGARDEGRGAAAVKELAADGGDVRHVRLDVTDEATVTAAAAWIEETFGRLDVLVNNAGISIENRCPATETTAAQMRRTYETNVFGVVTVTAAMLPLLRRSQAPRIVMLSSSIGSLTLWSDPDSPQRRYAPALLAYNSSKTALNALTVTYANALREEGIKVNAACPGYVATDLNRHAGTRTPAEGAEIVVRLATLPAGGPTGTFQSDNGAVPW